MTVQPQAACAFDAIAPRYDDIFTSSVIGRAQRAAVWADLVEAFHPGDRVLEIGCGTGVDACFVAEHGVRVLACDSSPQMIAVAEGRVREGGLQTLVKPIVLRAENIGDLAASHQFDGAFSNFGAVNCIEDMGSLANSLHALLKPRTKLLLCCLGPSCAWEIAWYLAHGKPGKAFRRWRKRNRAQIENGVVFEVHYPSVRSLAQSFKPHFVLKAVKGVGMLVPPTYLEHWA